MERENNTFINLVIPTSILGDTRLTPLERLILIYIISLCKKKGYCWAKNKNFEELFGVSKQTISKSISSLSKNNYIKLEYEWNNDNNSKRFIRESEVLKNNIKRIKDKYNTSIQENLNLYNKNNNKRNNIEPIITKDVDGVLLWNGKRCESQEASEEEIKLLEELLKEFKEQGDE